jgi:hypothetical protein
MKKKAKKVKKIKKADLKKIKGGLAAPVAPPYKKDVR